MKYLLLIYMTEDAMTPPEREQCYVDSTKLCHDLHSAGRFLGANPLHPVATATSLRIREGKRLVTDGPFAETKELIAGFWIWRVKSKQEAIEWVKRCPNPTGAEAEIEIRQIFEAEDFGEAFTPELREKEDRLRAKIEQQQKA